MRTVVFVAPFPLTATLRFCQALSRVPGIRLVGLFQEAPPEGSPFQKVFLTENVLDREQIRKGVEKVIARWGMPHRLLGVLENLQEQLAWVREGFGIPGMGTGVARVFRDKALMKDSLRAAGLPCARHRLLESEADARAFINEVGLPIVVKPPAGAGCKATYRVRNEDELRRCLAEARPSPQQPALAEEFLTGEEYSFETLTLDGLVRFHSITRYLPTPLEVVENPWVQWVVLAPRDISGPEYDPVRRLGQQVISAFGLETGITHMEWFRRPDGSLAVGEIAARPPGARIMDLMGFVHDRDLFLDWAELMVNGKVHGPYERKYAGATIFLRQPGQGRVAGIEGLDIAQREIGHLVVAHSLPQAGQPKAEGYEGEGWVILRHPDTAVVEDAVRRVFRTVRVRYS